MGRLMASGMRQPFRSESHPKTGCRTDEVMLYDVTRRPAIRYEYPLPEMSKGSTAVRTGMYRTVTRWAIETLTMGPPHPDHAGSLLIFTTWTGISSTSFR